MSLSEFMLVYLSFCQTDAFISPGGITENIQYPLILGTYLYMIYSSPEKEVLRDVGKATRHRTI